MSKNQIRYCGNCGATVETDVCPYCNAWSGDISESIGEISYPVIKGINAEFKFIYFVPIFLLIFVGLYFVIDGLNPLASKHDAMMNSYEALVGLELNFEFGVFLFWFIGYIGYMLPNLIGIALASLCICLGVWWLIYILVNFFQVKVLGEELDATVYGYINNKDYSNQSPTKTVKLLISTNDGLRILLHNTLDKKMLYKNNSKIKIRFYKNKYFILKKNINYF